MAPRPAWKGYLKLSLVTCAVELSNAVSHSEKVSFRILNKATGNFVKRQYVDADSGKPLKEADQVKGYETGKDEYLLIEEEEIEAVQIESSHTLAIDTFVDKASIAPVYLDTPYYLTPADKVSEEAFAVIREALERRKMAGLARIVLYRRERPAVVEPFGVGMLLTTLHYDATVRQPDSIFGEMKEARADPEMVAMAEKFIERKKVRFDPDEFRDPYEDALLKLIRAKKAGRKPRPAKQEAERPSNVVNLFEALKRSLEKDEGGGRKPAASPRRASPKTKSKTSKTRSASK